MSKSDSDEDDFEELTELGEQLIYCILAEEPLENIKALVADAPLWYQNDAEGISCLHAAAYTRNRELVKLLIDEGAIWNSVDYLHNTAADIALSFNDTEIYTLIRDAGLRAELLLAVLSSRGAPADTSAMILQANDTTALASTDAFLSSKLRFTVDQNGQEICMLDANGEEVGVMMGWEDGIMQETARTLSSELERPKVINVGFGLGIIDTLFQSLSPSLHVIVEAHPDVLSHMRQQGWYEKPGVKILEGKWQDFINSEKLDGLVPEGGFDIVYTDPFSEDYGELRRFFGHVPALLGPRGRFSFFHGLGATNPTIYDVYSRVAEVHLSDLGIDVKWSEVNYQRTDCLYASVEGIAADNCLSL